ncbi:MAG: sulfite exporter TauE/SafE family protein [Anaerolineae bacterium]|nr:sulfite exporter TauE/SafE family protein [Anaerolineae bacterium]
MTVAEIVVIVFLAALLQSLSGFGFAIVVMPLITLLLGMHTAAPTVALIALTAYTVNVVRYRHGIDRGEVLRLAAASAIGVPLGIWVLSNVDEAVVKRFLGAILIAYSTYALWQPAAGRTVPAWWVYPAGFFAGCLGGAYNTPGPPVILYGSLRCLPRDEFRAVLQALFLASGLMVVASHLVAGHVTGTVVRYYVYALPALAAGILAGAIIDRRVDHDMFRRLVTAMILMLGIVLLLGIA